MYQETIIVGNVGRIQDLRYTPNGSAVVDVSVAVNRKWTGKDGQAQEETTWFKCVCWNKLAETVHQYVTVGRQVLVTGRVSAEAWTDKEGNARAELVLNASEVKFLGKRDDDAPGGVSPYATSSDDLQDIPF